MCSPNTETACSTTLAPAEPCSAELPTSPGVPRHRTRAILGGSTCRRPGWATANALCGPRPPASVRRCYLLSQAGRGASRTRCSMVVTVYARHRCDANAVGVQQQRRTGRCCGEASSLVRANDGQCFLTAAGCQSARAFQPPRAGVEHRPERYPLAGHDIGAQPRGPKRVHRLLDAREF